MDVVIEQGREVMDRKELAKLLGVRELPCWAALRWVNETGHTTVEEIWQNCTRADWLVWWLGHLKVERKRLVYIACQALRPALQFAISDEPRIAIETAEAWTRGEATILKVQNAGAASLAHACTIDPFLGGYAADVATAASRIAYALRTRSVGACAFRISNALYANARGDAVSNGWRDAAAQADAVRSLVSLDEVLALIGQRKAK